MLFGRVGLDRDDQFTGDYHGVMVTVGVKQCDSGPIQNSVRISRTGAVGLVSRWGRVEFNTLEI